MSIIYILGGVCACAAFAQRTYEIIPDKKRRGQGGAKDVVRTIV